jgi:predicted nucleic acid-binding protein
MIVVADTSPINYLVLIDQPELLHKLYGDVVLPPAVLDELSAKNTRKGQGVA